MDGKGRRAELQGAVNRVDGTAVVGLAGAWLASNKALQLLGDGLLSALAHYVAGAAELAADCAGRLRARGWEGDDDLADQLDAARGAGVDPALKPWPSTLRNSRCSWRAELGEGGRIDRNTGDVWHESAVEYALEVDEEDEDSLEDEAFAGGRGPLRVGRLRRLGRGLPRHANLHRHSLRPGGCSPAH